MMTLNLNFDIIIIFTFFGSHVNLKSALQMGKSALRCLVNQDIQTSMDSLTLL
jgi:hypothetical protein